MRGEVLGVERRRRWSDAEKLAIVSEVGVDGATATLVARRHDITRQQIYSWRKALIRQGLWSPLGGAVFLPVGASEPISHAASPPKPIELLLGQGRSLRFDSGIDAAALTRLIRAVEAA